jgi:hypothetical protein
MYIALLLRERERERERELYKIHLMFETLNECRELFILKHFKFTFQSFKTFHKKFGSSQ